MLKRENNIDEFKETIEKLCNAFNRLRRLEKALQSKNHKSRKDQLEKVDQTKINNKSSLEIETLSTDVVSCDSPPKCLDESREIISLLDTAKQKAEYRRPSLECSIPELNAVSNYFLEVYEYVEAKCKELNWEYKRILEVFKGKFQGLKKYEFLEIPSIRDVLHFYCLKTSLYDYSNSYGRYYLDNLIKYNEKNNNIF